MLHQINRDLRGHAVEARDGGIGSVKDVLFDDARWVIRYLVVDTGHWLPGRRVLISPASVATLPPADKVVRLELSREQVRASPDASSQEPVSRQFEEAHARHYGYPFYWTGPYLWGQVQRPITGSPPVTAPPGPGNLERIAELEREEERARGSRLRSVETVTGYAVMALDGYIGEVEDLRMDDADWSVGAMLIETTKAASPGRLWMPVREVLHIDWIAREVRARANRDAIRQGDAA